MIVDAINQGGLLDGEEVQRERRASYFLGDGSGSVCSRCLFAPDRSFADYDHLIATRAADQAALLTSRRLYDVGFLFCLRI